MLTTSARLLHVLSLLQTRRDWSGVDLSRRLGITERTVRRDVARLRELGYPVEARPGTGGGYRLGAGAALPPLLLNDEEAVAVAVGLHSALLTGLTGIEETSVRALAKLEQVLPSRLRDRVRTLQSAVVPMIGPTQSVDTDVLLAVATAVRDHQRLRADYRSHDGAQTRRVLEPHKVVHSGRRWYLVAWDVDRADWRTFRLDRLTPRTPPGPRFTPREGPAADLSRYTSRGISTEPYRYRCRVTVVAPATAVAERIGPTVGVVTPLDDASCEVLAGSDSLTEVALYLGLLGAEIIVHEPPELRQHMADLGGRLTRAGEASRP